MTSIAEALEQSIEQISRRREESMIRQTSSETHGEHDVCPICKGSGWKTTVDKEGYEIYKKCECGLLRDKICESRSESSGIPEKYKVARLSRFSLDVYQQEGSKELIDFTYACIQCWLRDFEEMEQKGMGLYLFSGTPGSGKTFMAACLANELIRENGKRVRFATSMDIIEEIKRSWDFSSGHSESQVLQELTDTDVLIIDDFGVEQPKNWIAERFYQIINARYTLKKITIITSNLSVEDLKYDSRIKNRVQERTYQLPFPEESIRGQIARENMSDMMNRVKALREQQKHRNEQLTLKL